MLWGYVGRGHTFKSHAQHVFSIFQLENILRSNLNFSTSYGHLTDLKSLLGLLLVSFPCLSEKNFTEIFTCRRGDVCPLMSKRRLRSFPDLLNLFIQIWTSENFFNLIFYIQNKVPCWWKYKVLRSNGWILGKKFCESKWLGRLGICLWGAFCYGGTPLTNRRRRFSLCLGTRSTWQPAM